VGTEAGTSCSYGFDITMSQNPYGGGPSITPNRVRHNLDLTLRLNSTPSPAGDDGTMNAMTRHYRRTGFICRLKVMNLSSKPMNIW
jgi:hypothetical protein